MINTSFPTETQKFQEVHEFITAVTAPQQARKQPELDLRIATKNFNYNKPVLPG